MKGQGMNLRTALLALVVCAGLVVPACFG